VRPVWTAAVAFAGVAGDAQPPARVARGAATLRRLLLDRGVEPSGALA